MTRRLPVRWRLTIWFSVLLAITLVLLGSIVFFGLRARLYAEFDDQLLDQASLAQASIEDQNGLPVFNASGEDNVDYFRRVLDAKGRIRSDNSADFGGVPLDQPVVAAALAGKTEYSTLTSLGPSPDQADQTDQGDQSDPGREVLRIVTEPVRGGPNNAIVGALQLGSDRDDVDEPLSQLLIVLALVSPLALLAAAGGGYALSGRALAPVAAMTDLAARVGAQDLHARLQLDLPDDELGRLARTFDAMLARIEDAFARQRQFTADAAHELRTPLSLMRAQVDLALARPRSVSAYRDALRGLDTDLKRMTGLVSSLLTLARTDTGRLIPERTEFDLRETVALIVEQYTPLADEAGIELRAETEPALIAADEDLLVQVLVNLVDNAFAHTPRSGSVTVGCLPAAGEVRLWVSDTGSGIPLADQARIFDRFYRVEAGRARANGGTGLGLAICKAIVDAHGGTIALSSQIGHGTRVELALPRPNGDPQGAG